MKKVYNLAKGTARIAVSGAEPERVINCCSENAIEFWDTAAENEYKILITVHSVNVPQIKEFTRKNNCDLQILSSRGGKAITKSAKRRYALLAGLAVCVVAAAVSSMFIWNIEVKGNERLSYGEVMRVLNESGIEYGSFWPGKSADALKNDILLNHPEISWLSINMQNSEVEVVIHERENKPEIVKESEPRDIYAAKNGLITKISVLEGESTVSIGDTVCRGQCLISGTMVSETADDRRVHAMGDVEARTWYEITAVAPLKETVKTEKDGAETKFSLLAGKNRINFYSDSRNNEPCCDKINKIGYLSADGVFSMPLGIAVQTRKCYVPHEESVDFDSTVKRLQEGLLAELRYRIGEGEIISTSFTVSDNSEIVTVTLRAECLENIAVIKE